MARQKPTEADAEQWALSPQQRTAVDLLATGRTVTDTAEVVGVVRQTVSEWLNQHRGFRAALNARRQELWDGASDRLRALVPKALDVLAGDLERANTAAAIAVLKAAGLYGLDAPSGPTTVEDVKIEEDEREANRRSKVMFAALNMMP